MAFEHSHSCGGHAAATPSVHQSLGEMAFERGVWSAALDGEEDRVTKFLRDGGSPDALDSSGYAPLHYAARNGHAGVCRLLLRSGSDVNVRTRSGQATALHRAAYCGHMEVVRLLLSQPSADPTIQDADGKTPLHKAAERFRREVIELLLHRAPGLVHIKDNRGQVALDCVPEPNKQEMAKILEQ